MVKVVVIGICWGPPLVAALRAAPGLEVVGQVNLNRVNAPEHGPVLDRLQREPDTRVVTLNASAKFGAFGTAALREAGLPVLTYTNIRFDGLHPDIIRLHPFAGQTPIPTGIYHSRIVLKGFLEGRTVPDIVAAFYGDAYHAAGYYDVFEQSADELRRRDAACDVRFARPFLAMARRRPVLFTTDHPTQRPIVALANRICEALTGESINVPPDFFPNPLASDVYWPVYPEIAQALGLRYASAMQFAPARAGRDRPFMTLPEFVEASVAAYQATGAEALLGASPQVPRLMGRKPQPGRAVG